MPESTIDLIYDAAGNPALWDEALTGIADSLDSTSCILVDHQIGSWREPRFAHFGRLEPELNIKGARESFADSPLMPRLGSLGVGQIASSDAIMPLAEARRTGWYRDVMTPQDIAHCLMSPLLRDHDTVGAFFMVRGEAKGAFTDAEIERLSSILPHLARANHIRCRLDAYHALARGQQRLLDALDIGIVLVDEAGAARCANRAADDILVGGDGLRLRGPALQAADHASTTQLQRLIAETAGGGPGAAIPLPRRGSPDPLVILACPLRGAMRERLAGASPGRQTVALFIKDPARRGADGPEDAVVRFYGLTVAEARVAAKLASGLGIAGTAARLDLSENTVKMHAKRIYEKLGVASQVTLAQLFHRLAAPVRPSSTFASARESGAAGVAT